jgi:hypothetical protein
MVWYIPLVHLAAVSYDEMSFMRSLPFLDLPCRDEVLYDPLRPPVASLKDGTEPRLEAQLFEDDAQRVMECDNDGEIKRITFIFYHTEALSRVNMKLTTYKYLVHAVNLCNQLASH